MEGKEILTNYVWHDDYLINVHKIDEQHKALLNTANKLYSELLSHGDLDHIDKLFSDLIRQTKVHFQTEEDLMQSHRYPGYQRHKKLHDLLIQQITDLQDSQQAVKSIHFRQPWIERIEIADFLNAWLINHITDKDKELGIYLRDSGLLCEGISCFQHMFDDESD